MVARDGAGSRKAADGDNREARARRRKRKGSRRRGRATVILGRRLPVEGVVRVGGEHTARWWCGGGDAAIGHEQPPAFQRDDDDARKSQHISLTPITIQPRTGEAYLPDDDDDYKTTTSRRT